MRGSDASNNSRAEENYNFQVEESKDLHTEELEEVPIEDPQVEYVSQSSVESDADDSEEPEDDPEMDPEEDPEEESSAEADEEPAEEPSTCVSRVSSPWNYDQRKRTTKDASKEFASKLSAQSATGGTDPQSGKKMSVEATASDSDPLRVCQTQKKFRQEEGLQPELDAGFSVTDLHGKSVVSECVRSDESVATQEEHTGITGKRRRSRWEPQPEQNGETGEGKGISKRRTTRWASDESQLKEQPEQNGETGEGKGSNKRRTTRWATDESQLKVLVPIQLPDMKGSELDPKIQKLKSRLLEISNKLLSSELLDDRPGKERSPSPPPVYNNLGIRINTRKVRIVEKLVKERQSIISKLFKKIPRFPTFKTGSDYKPPKLSKKMYIPVKVYPTYNFVGLIMGPRGNTQKRMEKETGARILLRGKGSKCEGSKSQGSQKSLQNTSDEEDLHVIVEADNQQSLDAAVAMVEKLLIPIDGGMNDHKRAQLRELAELNGTLKKDNICRVCMQEGHLEYACPNQQSTFETVTTCGTCGSFCHPTSICPLKVSLSVNTKGKPKKEINDSSLYVGYLPQSVDEKRLRELFCPFGKLIEVKVIRDQSTGLSKGYAFVNFESPGDAAMAVMHMNGHKMEGKMLAVRVAGRPPPPASLPALNPIPVLNPLPMYPGHANIPTDVTSQTTWPGPPGSALPEAEAFFPQSEGFRGLPSSSTSLGYSNWLSESEATNARPSVVSGHTDSKLANSLDSLYRYPSQFPFSSPGFTSEFRSGPEYTVPQLSTYYATPIAKPSQPFHFKQTPESTGNRFTDRPQFP